MPSGLHNINEDLVYDLPFTWLRIDISSCLPMQGLARITKRMLRRTNEMLEW
jgi:hypothetical protein